MDTALGLGPSLPASSAFVLADSYGLGRVPVTNALVTLLKEFVVRHVVVFDVRLDLVERPVGKRVDFDKTSIVNLNNIHPRAEKRTKMHLTQNARVAEAIKAYNALPDTVRKAITSDSQAAKDASATPSDGLRQDTSAVQPADTSSTNAAEPDLSHPQVGQPINPENRNIIAHHARMKERPSAAA